MESLIKFAIIREYYGNLDYLEKELKLKINKIKKIDKLY